MKRTSYLWSMVAMAFAVMLSAGFVSCGDDDEKESADGEGTQGGGPSLNSLGYLDPTVKWGASKSAVKTYMNGYELKYESDDLLSFDGKNIESSYFYIFDEGKLVISEVDFDLDDIARNTLSSKLTADNYEWVQKKDTVDLYLSKDQKTFATLATSSYYGVYELRYYDYEWMAQSTTSTLFEAPYVTWGATKSAVKADRTNSGYVLAQEDDDMLMYEGKYQETVSMYNFDSGLLINSIVVVEEAVADEEAVGNYLEKTWGFSYVATNNGYTFYTLSSILAATYVTPVQGNNYVYIIFMDGSSSARSLSGATFAYPELTITPEMERAIQNAVMTKKLSKVMSFINKAKLQK